MKIGIRVIKTVFSVTIAMSIASFLNLLYPASAGLIALLSLTNTKRSTFRTGLARIISLIIATLIAVVCFSLFGYSAFSFGLYLLLFIPLVVKLKLEDGISISSVLVSQYLVEHSVSYFYIKNAFLLLMIGAGTALLFNLYMPDIEKELNQLQLKIEKQMRILLMMMAQCLKEKSEEKTVKDKLKQTIADIEDGQLAAQTHRDNHLFTKDIYYIRYFDMRRVQLGILDNMTFLLEKIYADSTQSLLLQELLYFTADTLSEKNDGQRITKKIKEVIDEYRRSSLPKTREEFENRAILFQFLTEFQLLIEIKKDFYNELIQENSEFL